jgi:undecaprenyl diphosphate synthase
MARTAACTRLRLNLFVSYGSRAEIVRAVRGIAQDVSAGRIDPAQVDEALLSGRLFTAGCPDPDLLIRTSGELRVSNFLLWQIAYTELVISPVLWPDFGRRHLYEAILEYQRRDRRFGRVQA